MNAYLLQDEEHYVVVAESMQGAITHAEHVFVCDNYPELEDDTPATLADLNEAREEFRSQLQSCALVGPVR